ncbi:MAG: sterol desaturase family protein [Microthrixaceae bacterium]|nr:sterol desaturase family protein [Microthrixaceae bacterium]MCO5314001.1 sterol desaturase family protein [Microthrixaceae bacterium]HPB45542.1 sterol desaturase family protein [Microthrixaceae bacterium]
MAALVVAALAIVGCFAAGAFAWTLGEYLLHSSFHWAKGKGLASREHLGHHVRASWRFDPVLLLAWLGVVLVGAGLAWLGSRWVPSVVAFSFSAGWTVGYFFYEWHHRAAHLRGPRNRWERWLRINHFQHHFGHPTKNQQVTIPLWDHVFGTAYTADVVRVPRRLAMPWLLDEDGNLRPEFVGDYVIVGDDRSTTERGIALDTARAFANLAPTSNDPASEVGARVR